MNSIRNLCRKRYLSAILRHPRLKSTVARRKDLTSLVSAMKDPSKSLICESKFNKERFLIGFVCQKCRAQVNKSFTKHSYYNGIVIICCDGCDSLHLIADNLKWFSEKPWNVEEILMKEGIEWEKRFEVVNEEDLKKKVQTGWKVRTNRT